MTSNTDKDPFADLETDHHAERQDACREVFENGKPVTLRIIFSTPEMVQSVRILRRLEDLNEATVREAFNDDKSWGSEARTVFAAATSYEMVRAILAVGNVEPPHALSYAGTISDRAKRETETVEDETAELEIWAASKPANSQYRILTRSEDGYGSIPVGGSWRSARALMGALETESELLYCRVEFRADASDTWSPVEGLSYGRQKAFSFSCNRAETTPEEYRKREIYGMYEKYIG